MRYQWFFFFVVIGHFFLPAGYAQDVIIQGCYWSCPEDDPNSPIDSSSLVFWVDKMKKQSPALAHAGFTHIWLPSLQTAPPVVVKPLIDNLKSQGISPIAALTINRDSISAFLPLVRQLDSTLGINAYSIASPKTIEPEKIAAALNSFYQDEQPVGLLVAEIRPTGFTGPASEWVNETSQYLNFQPQLEQQPRIYDFPLREALRLACTSSDYDVRLLFENSIRDASSLSGFNIVTLINHPTFKNQNGKEGDFDDPVEDPLLAYAYLLSNNQLGLPAVFYGDYYGAQSNVEGYDEATPLKEAIDQLIKAHHDFIFGATAVEYLNHIGSDKRWKSIDPDIPVDSSGFILFQLDGTYTPAGRQNNPPGNKDVLVGINFSYDTLLLQHEINLSNIQKEDFFTDVIGNAFETQSPLSILDSTTMEYNAVNIGLPPRSYAIWVQGRATAVVPSRIQLSAEGTDNLIEVSWEAAYESNTLGYELERSVNGKSFERLISYKAISGSDDPASYIFLDQDVYPNEQLYYRVKLLDEEGGYEYSAVKTATLFKRDLNVELLDHNANDWKKLLIINSNAKADGLIEVYNAKGELVLAQTQSIKNGETISHIDMTGLSQGVYFIYFKIKDKQWWSTRVAKF
jgi:hypothetical protein